EAALEEPRSLDAHAAGLAYERRVAVRIGHADESGVVLDREIAAQLAAAVLSRCANRLDEAPLAFGGAESVQAALIGQIAAAGRTNPELAVRDAQALPEHPRHAVRSRDALHPAPRTILASKDVHLAQRRRADENRVAGDRHRGAESAEEI